MFRDIIRCGLSLFLLLLVSGSTTMAAKPVLPPDVKPTMVLEKGAGEGPAWHPQLGLLTSGDGHIMRLDLMRKQSVYRKGAGSNGLLFDRHQRLLICEPVRRVVSRIDQNGQMAILAKDYGGKKFNQPNDITVDSKGRIYFSDPRYGDRGDMQQEDDDGRKIEGVYRIDTNGRVSRVITHEVDRPNGLLVTPDDRTLFVADNNNNEVGAARKLWKFALNDGVVDLTTRQLVYDWGSSRGPDGMVLDREGRLFVAGGLNQANLPAETTDKKGGVYVFSAEGKLIEFIPIPRDEVTNCTFGGPDLKTLYVTAGGTLWSVPVVVPGQLVWAK